MTRHAGQSIQRPNDRFRFGRESHTARTPPGHIAFLSLTNCINRDPLRDQACNCATWCDNYLLGPVLACVGHTD